MQMIDMETLEESNVCGGRTIETKEAWNKTLNSAYESMLFIENLLKMLTGEAVPAEKEAVLSAVGQEKKAAC